MIEEFLVFVVAENEAVLSVVKWNPSEIDSIASVRRCSLAASAACSAVLRAVTSLQKPTTSFG